MGRLDTKVALVTGGASGIGRAVAERLVDDGATVLITDRRSDAAAEVARELRCDAAEQDVTDEDRWDEIVATVLSRYGAFDILVNNAGILGPAHDVSPEDTPFGDWKHVMAVNVDGVFLGCRAAIRGMRLDGRGGSIVNISSIAGELATPYATAYGASKATVTQLTKSVAQHCAESGLRIRCNSVHPGNVHTALHDDRAEQLSAILGTPAAEILNTSANSPLGGWVPIDQVAAAVSYLASDEASHVTGTKIVVDGGTLGCDSFGRFTTPVRADADTR